MNNGRKGTKIMLKCNQFIRELIENMIKHAIVPKGPVDNFGSCISKTRFGCVF